MYCYGVRGIVVDWFKNYLSNRMRYVSLNNVNSKLQPVTCGVPQGSILGPLLFILCINYINNVSTSTKLIMFADDTNLLSKHENVNRLFANVNKQLQKVSKWFKLNKLSLNITKLIS